MRSCWLSLTDHSKNEKSPRIQTAGIQAEVKDISDWTQLSPALHNKIEPYHARGPLSFQLTGRQLGNKQSFFINADATGGQFNLPNQITKSADVPATFSLRFESTAKKDVSEQQWRITEGRARLAGLHLDNIKGQLQVKSNTSPINTNNLTDSLQTPIIKTIHLRSAGTLDWDAVPPELHPLCKRYCHEFDLGGELDWQAYFNADQTLATLSGSVNADDMTFRIPTNNETFTNLQKTKDVPATLAFNIARPLSSDTRTDERLYLDHLSLTLADNLLTACGEITPATPSTDKKQSPQADLVVNLDLDDPGQLTAIFQESPVEEFAGRCEASANIHLSPQDNELRTSRLAFDHFTITAGSDPLHLDGTIVHKSNQLNTNQLQWSWGKSRGTISALLHAPRTNRQSLVGITSDYIDIPALKKNMRLLLGLQEKSTTSPAITPASSNKKLPNLLSYLGKMNLAADVHVDQIVLQLPPKMIVNTQALTQHFTIKKGRAKLEFSAAVDGGLAEGILDTNLLVAEPVYHLAYQADRIQPGEVTDAYLDNMFPGMTAAGPLTIVDETYQRLLPTPGRPNFEVGKGELIIEGGTVRGRAAPKWMTKIFPRLDLAGFDFSYMHSWFEKFRSGRIRHQIIYQGRYYNIYSVGYNDPDGHMEYEVGIDLLADLDSRYWAETGQGRIPLFTKTGHIRPDGSLGDEAVYYMPRSFIWSLLMKNNPVIAAYHAIRQQVTKKQ